MYYIAAERANKGQFMLTEATEVALNGHGYPNTPGIYTEAQIEAWKPIVKAVKDKGAIFFCQIWHCGRASHSVYNEGLSLPARFLFLLPCSGLGAIRFVFVLFLSSDHQFPESLVLSVTATSPLPLLCSLLLC